MGNRSQVKTAEERWVRTGFADGNSGLGMRVPTGHLLVPGKIELDSRGERLNWEWGAQSSRKSSKTMFNDFVRLWKRSEDSPEPILKYARAWGILWLDDDARPCGIKGPFWPMVGTEAIDAWRYVSHRAFAVLNIASDLREGKPGSRADWEVLASNKYSHWGDAGFPIDSAGSFVIDISENEARARMQGELTNWLKLGSVSFAIKWSKSLWPGLGRISVSGPKRWELQIDYDGCLFAAIALQLATTVARGDLFVCHGCHFPYLRPREERQPKPGQRNFCEECRQPAAGDGPKTPPSMRKADEHRREKIRMARELHSQGVVVREIVKRLNVRNTVRSLATNTVRRWIEKGK